MIDWLATNPWLGIVAVLTLLGLLIGGLKFVTHRISPELSRKAVHIGMGFICLSFPWTFREAWPVMLLAFLSVIGLTAARFAPRLQKEVGGVLGGVGRESLGEFYFPIAVATVFLLAKGDALLYVIPILTLTVADSVGALVGVRYGSARYQTDEGFKSMEGSLAFFVAAFLSTHIPLLLFTQVGRAETLLISLTAGFLVMLFEAIAWRGRDNLIIPIGMFFLLQLFIPLDVPALLGRLLVITSLVILVGILRRRTTLSDSGVIAAALSGYAVWAFGGWFWLFPPLLLFLIYIGLPSFNTEARPVQNLYVVTRVMAGGFLWLFLARVLDRSDFLVPYFLCMAAHAGNTTTARLRNVRKDLSLPQILAIGWSVPTVLFGLLGAIGALLNVWPLHTLGWTALAVAISVTLFVPAWPVEHSSENRARVWFAQTSIAIFASLIGLIGKILP
jgi:phytol kinase